MLLLLLGGAIFAMSCRLTFTTARSGSLDRSSVATVLFGGAREALAARFYETADLYFHRGVAHKHATAFQNTFVQRLNEKISPSEHLHASGQSVKEIMPWLWLSIQMDPQNTQGYLVASFWLAGEGGRPDLALDVLREAQCAIPFNYEVQLAKGRIDLEQHDVAAARTAFDAALAFWPGDANPEEKGPRMDKAEALLYRALIYEVDGNPGKAAALLRNVVTLFPERTSLLPRIEALEQGRQPAVLATSLWNDMLARYSEERAVCHRENDGDEGDADDHAEHIEPHVH